MGRETDKVEPRGVRFYDEGLVERRSTSEREKAGKGQRRESEKVQ